jgi:UbiD family decarboxylase
VVTGLAAIGEPEVKVAVVVDEDIDVYNEKELLWAVGTRAVADLDIHIIPRMLGAKLDPSAYDFNRLKRGVMVSKVVIDATKPMGQPFATRTTPPRKLWESMNLEDYLK